MGVLLRHGPFHERLTNAVKAPPKRLSACFSRRQKFIKLTKRRHGGPDPSTRTMSTQRRGAASRSSCVAAIRATPGPFTERICGVCTGAHALTSVRSVENALAINIPENTNSTRNIMPLAPQVHVLIVDFYHLHAVDVVSADPKAPRRWRSRSRPGWLVQGAQRPKTSGRCSFLTRWMRSFSIRSKSAIRRSPPARRKWIFATAPRGCGKSTRPILNELRKPWERAGNL